MSPVEIQHHVSEVYGVNRDLPLNYVGRTAVDDVFLDNLTRGKHIVIHGSSKQGKTSLRKQCLAEQDYIAVHCSNKWRVAELHAAILKSAGYEVVQSTTKSAAGKNKVLATAAAGIFGIGGSAGGERESTTADATVKAPLELDLEDVNDVIRALNTLNRVIVLEDFHYLAPETQRDFAVALKAFHEQSALCFVIIGVWLEESRLTAYNGDLVGRVIAINADKWSRDELHRVIVAGEYLLNVKFDDDFTKTLLNQCFDSVYIVQEACYRACTSVHVYVTQETQVVVAPRAGAGAIVREIVDEQTGRYNSFIALFAEGFGDEYSEVYRWLLYPVIMAGVDSLERGLRYREMYRSIVSHCPFRRIVNPHLFARALQSVPALQIRKGITPIILDYDQTNLRLNIVDRGFLVWLRHQNLTQLLEIAGLDLP